MKLIKYAIKDLRKPKEVKLWNKLNGNIIGYCSANGVAFGSGKTLFSVCHCTEIWTKLNKYYDVEILSNIQLANLPYYSVQNLNQIIEKLEENYGNEKKVHIVLFDEIGFLFNSRNFKENFTTEFLAKLLTCRHYNCIFIFTAQNFGLVDKIFRDLTTEIRLCSHTWRFFRYRGYRPLDIENRDVTTIVPISRKRLFADDDVFGQYDTKENVKILKKEKYVDNLEYISPNVDNSVKEKKKYRKKRKKQT